jgi:hypothetical protein
MTAPLRPRAHLSRSYIPSRIARTYLHSTYKTKVSVQAVGLSVSSPAPSERSAYG